MPFTPTSHAHDPTHTAADTRPALPAGVFVAMLLGGGLLGFGYDLVHNQFVKLTSSITMAVMGNAKLIVLIVISMIWFETITVDATFAVNLFGIVLGVSGCIWYSWHKLSEARSSPPKVVDDAKTEATALVKSDEPPEGGRCCAIS